MLGIEINPYAKELASVSIWIGHIQWMLDHGYGFPRDPVLQPLDNIGLRDAILAHTAEGAPIPPTWPEAEFIVGNPPFLGTKRMRLSLGDEYVNDLFLAWTRVVSQRSDLVCYWHEIARRQISSGAASRAGLLATNSIRNSTNRGVLERIKESGDIFMAWHDEPWVVEGAAVRISIIGQDDGSEEQRVLDGEPVGEIHSNLTSGIDLTRMLNLSENRNVCFQGDIMGGPFDITGEVARRMLREPTNINGRTNEDVVVPCVNGMDIVQRARDMFIIDFGSNMTEAAAAAYESPFSYVDKHVRPVRIKKREKVARERWWLHQRSRPEMRAALAPLKRFIGTPRVAKHRLFTWLSAPTLPGTRLVIVARDDDYTFGILQSRVHEVWSIQTGANHGVGNDPQYTPTESFETFPFPWPLDTPEEALTTEQRRNRDTIAEAARALDTARQHWLNPPELVREDPDVLPSLPPRLIPLNQEAERQLHQRTLTALYNARPAWLANLHAALDAAVFAAYGWPDTLEDENLLERLLDLNLSRAHFRIAQHT